MAMMRQVFSVYVLLMHSAHVSVCTYRYAPVLSVWCVFAHENKQQGGTHMRSEVYCVFFFHFSLPYYVLFTPFSAYLTSLLSWPVFPSQIPGSLALGAPQ